MSLAELNLKKIYRTKQDDVVELLLAPALKESCVYDRGTGYFTLGALAELADGLIPFIQHGGTMRVVTSVRLSDEDIEIIKKGISLSGDDVAKKIQEEIEEVVEDKGQLLKLDLITNLIATGKLSIRVAYMPDGIYHEKIGIFEDSDGNSIYFSGSNNETVSGLNKNWETFMLLASWWGDKKLIQEQKQYYEQLWVNDIDGLKVMTFPEAEERNLIRKYKVSLDVKTAIKRIQKETQSRGK